jgi:hypothetical protein
MIRYSFYLLAKMVRSAPGSTEPAANEPGAGGGGTGLVNCAESENLTTFQFADCKAVTPFVNLLLRSIE